MDLWTIAITAVGAVATFSLGLATEAWRARLGMTAARTEREAVRSTVRQDRREDFELATLLELQDVLQVMARQAGRAHHHDDMHYRTTGRWLAGADPLPDDVGGDASLEVRWAFLRLKARVPSEDLRATLEKFHDSSTAAVTTVAGDGSNDSQLREDALRLSKQMADDLETAQDALGERIRALHAT